VARLPLALGVKLQQPLGQILCCGLGSGAAAGPFRAAHFGQLHRLILAPGADIFGHQIKLGAGHVQAVRPGVAYLHVVLFKAVHRHLHDAGKAAYAVVLVDHQIAHRKVGVADVSRWLSGSFFFREAFSFTRTSWESVSMASFDKLGVFHAGGKGAPGDDAARPFSGRSFSALSAHVWPECRGPAKKPFSTPARRISPASTMTL
jgi:hypothetical protein